MKLGLDITPDLVAVMAAEIKAGEKAVSAAMREAGTGLKSAWRGQITQAGLGVSPTRSATRPFRARAKALMQRHWYGPKPRSSWVLTTLAR